MKKLFIYILSLFCFACQAEQEIVIVPEQDATISIDTSQELTLVGTLREGLAINNDEVYIEVAYSNSTGVTMVIMEGETLPSGVYFKNRTIQTSSGSGKMKIFLTGTPDDLSGYGDEFQLQDVDFTMFMYNTSLDFNLTSQFKVWGQGEQLADPIFSLSAEFGDTYKYGELNSDAYLNLDFTNGYSRKVSLEILNDDISLVGDGSVNYDGVSYTSYLSDGSIKIPVSGYAPSEDFTVKLKLTYLDGDNNTVSKQEDSQIITVQSKDVEFLSSLSLSGLWGGDCYLVASYNYGQMRDIKVSVEFSDSNLSIKQTDFTLEGDSGKVSIPVEGVPSAGFLSITATITGDDISEDIVVKYSETVSSNSVEVTSVEFLAPYADNGTDLSPAQVVVTYTGGDIGEKFKLTNVSGLEPYVSYDFSEEQSIVISEQSGKVTFYLDTLQIEGGLTGQETYPANKTLDIVLGYNNKDCNVETKEVEIKGFYWDGFHYNVIYANGAYWLDRNLRAATNECGVATYSGGKISTWDYNPSSYGAYYQRGRATGIDLDLDNFDSTPIIEGTTGEYGNDWVDNYWVEAPEDILPSTTQSKEQTDILDYHWNAQGGESNPCPPGFRVPSGDELLNMLQTYVVLESSVCDPMTQLINSDMRVPAAGSYSSGNQVMVGSGTEVASGQIRLLTYEYQSGNTAGTYVRRVYASSANGALTYNTYVAHDMAMPVRAIKK